VLDEVEERRLAPLDVVEDDHERAFVRMGLEQLARGPERLLAGSGVVLEPDGRRDPVGDQPRVLVSLQLRRDAGDDLLAVQLSHRLEERPERDPVAVRETAPAGDGGRVGDLLEELLDQARFPDPGGAEHGEEVACALPDRPLVRLLEQMPLPIPAHHRRVEPSRPLRHALLDREDSKGRDGRALALQCERLDRLRVDRIADEPVRRFADEDLTGSGGLLEALGDVDGVARNEGFTATRDDLASVEPDPELERHTRIPLELLVQRQQGSAELVRSTHGAERVVLVQGRDPEDGHDGVADELLHRAAVPLDGRTGRLEVARHDAAQGLGIELLAECRRADDVREQHGHRLADLVALRHEPSLRLESRDITRDI
jgi:hypothetical protein